MNRSKQTIPIAKPELDETEIAAVSEVIRSGWIIQGTRVLEFERAFAEYVGAPEAIAVSSGTAALHLALYAANCGPGDSVICPSYSFIASANVIRYCGAEPIFVDIDRQTCNINPALLAEVCQSNTKAILAVHQVGLPAPLDEIIAFAKRHNLIVIEDAACAIGSQYRGQRIGKPHTLAACFSFHPRKIITTGDGGMITTADHKLAERMRCLRQHGVGKAGEGYLEVGFNYRLTDMQAALGVEQLKKLPIMLAHRREQAARYTAAFQGRRGLAVPVESPQTVSNFQSYQLRIEPTAPITRDQLLQELIARGINAQPGITPIHLESIYADIAKAPLPETVQAAREIIMLPIYHSLTYQQQDFIIDSILELLEEQNS
ncbi:MAG: DegT/DnrJ/EryC1/StrS family aminotransferase [Acidobacteriota bacterium]